MEIVPGSGYTTLKNLLGDLCLRGTHQRFMEINLEGREEIVLDIFLARRKVRLNNTAPTEKLH